MAYNIVFFGPTYSCEKFFSKMDFIKSPCRAVVTDEHLENGFRIASTSAKANLNKVIKKKASCMFHTELFLQRLNRIAMFLF